MGIITCMYCMSVCVCMRVNLFTHTAVCMRVCIVWTGSFWKRGCHGNSKKQEMLFGLWDDAEKRGGREGEGEREMGL